MAVPTIDSVAPTQGPSSGGDLVRVVGTHFAPRVLVSFGGLPGVVTAVREEAGQSIVDVRSPQHEAGTVDVAVQNIDSTGATIVGERAVLVGAYRYVRPRLAQESDLTRLVRQLLRELKRQVLANVSATVSVDYDDTPDDGVIAMASLPSVVLSGPGMRQDRFFSSNEAPEEVVLGSAGPELARRRPAYTVDLVFTITVASARTAELLNLMAAVATFLNRNRWVELDRNPVEPGLGRVRWEMDADGELRTQLGGKDDVRAFTWGFVVRGFDVDEGQLLDRGRAVTEPRIESTALPEQVP